ncbi:hypothetical protein [Sphingomonas sp.]|uniref:hypothetical protein n=1 Tax=Sphingomonas sp. TaxID=28214 RepID=UPI002DD683DD|nr:hypothetical protein [Sphingomonas sp.]
MADDRGDSADRDSYLAANPGQTARDYKGKGFDEFHPFLKHHVTPGERAWDKLNPIEVRRAATTEKARFLSRGERQAAGRDPGLVWDERSRSYRLRADIPPAPPEGPGGHESFDQARFQTGAGQRCD